MLDPTFSTTESWTRDSSNGNPVMSIKAPVGASRYDDLVEHIYILIRVYLSPIALFVPTASVATPVPPCESMCANDRAP